MILLGLTTWSEHPRLVNKEKTSLTEYSSKLPVVEIDTSFYGIPRLSTVRQWVDATPANFQFIVKGHQAMTQHRDWRDFFQSEEEMYRLFLMNFEPLITSGKLGAFLFQFPASFHCETANIVYLRRLRKILPNLPLAIEFRHSSWYEPQWLQTMLTFMKEENFILVNVDEPQVANQSVPLYPVVTNKKLSLFRLHGRNQSGWQATGENWRKERTLYDYHGHELTELAQLITATSQQAEQTVVIFNNNSGGHAAGNLLALKELLNIEYSGLNPEQLDLF